MDDSAGLAQAILGGDLDVKPEELVVDDDGSDDDPASWPARRRRSASRYRPTAPFTTRRWRA
ncbi:MULTISPECIES: hypothetical protein [unclassified Pseudofrankia]|uniref:hypothetical protein n=1 Tax=unclassified Pseudofrankia TaxID=2994372 RepID=UPI0008D9FABD|nr:MULTISPECIES: hypothetical protein [unclassified Pseudofrankia]MDT3444877.1 hypothetical protein [Pseudofrankia sp. BMG5.37]OHV74206.1 hypothetical protein BCD48_32505 [Pseudofrankia sp. BMG5.36]